MRLTPLDRRAVAFLVLTLVGASLAEAQVGGGRASSSVVAVVGGAPILASDLDRWWQEHDPAAYERARRDAYDGRRKALDALIESTLLAAAAAARGLSVDELVLREVEARVRAVSPAEVSAFLSTNPMPAGTSLAVVTPLVEALLRQRARELARHDYLASLQAMPGAHVQILLEAPRVATTRAAHNPTRGPLGAPVEVVVYSDFECPFCRRAEPALARLLERFPTEVVMVWRHFPLGIHARAREAAEAAQCAHDQGRFWAYHDALFADPAAIAPDALVATAVRLGLDRPTFARCVRDHVHAATVVHDSEAGERAGVSGTPTVFINGVPFVGALPFEAYERAILDELDRVGRRQSDTPTGTEVVR